MTTVRQIMRELDRLLALEYQRPSQQPLQAQPTERYDRQLGAAKMRIEIDRYFEDWRAFDDEFEQIKDQTPAPTALSEPEFIAPAVLRIRPENLDDVQSDRWRAWAWELQLQRAGDACYLPSPAEVDYMTRLLTIWGEDYLIRWTDAQDVRPRRGVVGNSVADDVRAVIAALDQTHFGLDDISRRLPDVPRIRVTNTVNTLLRSKTPVIRRISMDPASIYERIKPTDTTPARRKPRAAHTRTTKTMRPLQHAVATRAE